ADLVLRESDDAALTVVSLPNSAAELSTYTDALPAVLLTKPATLFQDEDAGERLKPINLSITADDIVTQESVAYPKAPEVRELFERSQAEQQSVLIWIETVPVANTHVELQTLVSDIRKSVHRQFVLVGKTRDTSKLRLGRVISRAQTALLFQGQKLIQTMNESSTATWRARVDSTASSLEDTNARLLDLAPGMLDIYVDPSDLKPEANDPDHVRRIKTKRRRIAWLTRRRPRVAIPARGLSRHWLVEQSLHGWNDTLSELVVSTTETVFTCGRLLIDASLALDKVTNGKEDQDIYNAVNAEHERILARFDEFASQLTEQAAGLRRRLRRNGQRHLASLTTDLVAIDAVRRLRGYRQEAADLPEIDTFAGPVATNVSLVYQQVLHSLTVASFSRRLRTIIERTHASITLHLESGPVRELDRLTQQLTEARSALASGQNPQLTINTGDISRFDNEGVVADLVREISTAVRELPTNIKNIDHALSDALESAPLTAISPTSLDLRRLVQFVIEGELIGSLRTVLSRIPTEEQRAQEAFQDVFRLVTFHTTGTEYADDDHDSRLNTVIETALERLTEEKQHLEDLAATVSQRFTDALSRVVERLETWCRTGSTEALQARLDVTNRLTGMDLLTRSAGAAARNVLARSIYRRSQEQLARQSKNRLTRQSAAESLLELVRQCTPDQEILESLPFYYYQLFLGRSVIDKSFWIGRENELTQFASTVDSWRNGYGGGTLIVGERLNGRGSFSRFAISRHFTTDRTIVVPAPSTGLAGIDQFDRAVQQAAGIPGSANEILHRLPEGTVIHLSALEQWWERREGGFDVLEYISNLIDEHGSRSFFVMDMNLHAYRFANQFTPLAESVLSVIEAGRVPAADIESIVMLRHRSTGLYCTLDEKHEDDIAEWTTARLFERHFAASHGRIGVALQSWV
ncbi:MAG: hypothetical protein VX223_00750, partial [Myxococcota bacterium]|nr:hypothetical protein [Myxococcota bacterium]